MRYGVSSWPSSLDRSVYSLRISRARLWRSYCSNCHYWLLLYWLLLAAFIVVVTDIFIFTNIANTASNLLSPLAGEPYSPLTRLNQRLGDGDSFLRREATLILVLVFSFSFRDDNTSHRAIKNIFLLHTSPKKTSTSENHIHLASSHLFQSFRKLAMTKPSFTHHPIFGAMAPIHPAALRLAPRQPHFTPCARLVDVDARLGRHGTIPLLN